MKDLDARARARGCSRSAEVLHLLHEARARSSEDPRVTVARLKLQAAAEKRLGDEARALAKIEAAHYRQIIVSDKLRSRFVLSLPTPPASTPGAGGE